MTDSATQHEDGGEPRRPRHPELFAAVAAFIEDARTAYLSLPESAWKPTVSAMPEIRPFESGFPYITQDQFTKVPDYGRAFGPEEGQFVRISYGAWPSFKRLVAVIDGDERLRRYLGVRDRESRAGDEMAHRFDEVSIGLLPLGVFDRLMHLHGEAFTEQQLAAVYDEVEQALSDDDLPVWFVAPIALTGFPSDAMEAVGPDVFVARLPDALNMARMPTVVSGTAVNQLVLSAATHGVVLTNWTIPNESRWTLGSRDIEWYPSDRIDRFFDALRAVTGFDTGYAQIFMVPLGWAIRYRADLPPVLTGAVVRRYPSHFENAGWNQQRPAVTETQFAEVGRLYRAFASDSGSLALAGRRLSAAMLREDEADAILDLLIGLEALLGDQSTTEVTHKLAVRAAAVLAQLSVAQSDPVEVFKSLRRIYGYRSAVAHGNQKKAHKLRTVALEDGEKSTAEVARHYLQQVLVALADHPDLRDGQAIDETLVLPALRTPDRQQPNAKG